MTRATDPGGAASPRFGRQRALARLALVWEAVLPRSWPLLGAIGLFLVLALLEVPQRLPFAAHLLLLAAFALAIAGLGWRGFRDFALPDAAAAERRLERDTGLRHQPLAALADRPAATDDPQALALWQAHQARAAAAVGRLRLRAPRPVLAVRDPRALRAALALGLLAALAVAGEAAPARLWHALAPTLAGPAPPPGLRLEAWVTPPAYTGAAPIFLDAAGGAATVPQGSRLQVALSGGSGGVPELARAGAAPLPLQALDPRSFAAETTLDEGGALTLRRDGRDLARWLLTVQADAPPQAAFPDPPARATRGLGLRLPWRAEDDWGLAGLRAELRLDARPAAPPLTLDITLPGSAPRTARGTAQPDLSAHPWAGLPVQLRLIARDGAGQEGASADAPLLLPERSFNHPVAKQLIGVRKQLSVAPEAREEAQQALDAVADAPQAFEHDAATALALRAARSRLAFDRRSEAVAEVQEILWEVALALEEGRDGRTLRALQQAREALREALAEAERLQREQAEPARPGEPPNPDRQRRMAEIQRRIQELRDAIRNHLDALAERLQRENAEALPFDPQSRLMDQRDMDRRTRRMEDAAREGRMQDAQRELAELEEMLRALEEGRSSRADSPERQQRRERGQQQMGVVQDMVRRQGEMLDRSHQRAESEEQRRAQAQRQRRQQQSFRWPPDPPAAAPQPPPPSAEAEQQAREREQDARRQRALRRALGELMQQFGDLAGEVPEGLGRADQAMRDAQEALGDGGDARDAQQRAMRALTEGGRQMAQSMQRQFGQGQEGEEDGEAGDMAGEGQPGSDGQDQAQGQGEGRDPLGRRSREVNGQPDAGSDTRVPDEAELLRTRQLQEELRRRAAEKERPTEELDYYDRLLRRF
jgi:uncharacterized protein (TIGR02302 family)